MERLVSGAWLEQELGAPDLRILDCTVVLEPGPDGRAGYRSGRSGWDDGHIPGSAHADLTEELSDRSSPVPFMLPPAEQFAEVMSRFGVGEGTRVVLYDAGFNIWAARVWWMLRAFGYDDAAVLDGGWRAWNVEGRPTSADPAPDHPPGTFVARPRPGLFVGKDDVLAALDRDDVTIVDALPEDMFRGERQSYPRPGHIPGACNVPFASLVDPETHRYLPAEQLSAACSRVFAGSPSRVITYCGGGVAASSDAFVLNLLGLDEVAVYDGSLWEWTADPSLPLVCGAE